VGQKGNDQQHYQFLLGKDEKMISLQADKDLSDHQEEMLDLIKSKSLKLPPMTLKVFNLYAIDGYMHNEIAELLGISEGTSAWHYSEAKKRIRQMIGLESRIVDNGK
jgi:DNA-directed RNA polymerase specialized sigma24 family protein